MVDDINIRLCLEFYIIVFGFFRFVFFTFGTLFVELFVFLFDFS